MEGEEHGVSWDEEALAGHEGQVRVRVGEEGEGGGKMSCMAGGNHPTDNHWWRKVKVEKFYEDNRLLKSPGIPICSKGRQVKASFSH